MSDILDMVVISDTHGSTPELPYSKLLLICGDICPCTGGHHPTTQYHWFWNHFVPWIEHQADEIVLIAGNHDYMFQTMMIRHDEGNFRKKLPKNIHYLRDSAITINEKKIYGTPWTKMFYNWAFNLEETQLIAKYSKIPDQTDILMCHGPAYSLSDVVLQPNPYGTSSGNLGSQSLYTILESKHVKEFYYGHIHTADHTQKTIKFPSGHEMKYCCTSILDEHYKPFYVPMQNKKLVETDIFKEAIK
jgi:Icc-related predicted phosphoesterase